MGYNFGLQISPPLYPLLAENTGIFDEWNARHAGGQRFKSSIAHSQIPNLPRTYVNSDVATTGWRRFGLRFCPIKRVRCLRPTECFNVILNTN